MLPAAHNSGLHFRRYHALPCGDSILLPSHLSGVSSSSDASVHTFAASLGAALVLGPAARVGGRHTLHLRQSQLLRAAGNDILQQPIGEPLLWPDGAVSNINPTIPASSAGGSAAGNSGSAGAGSSLYKEAFRPRRLSAPVIARLLRSTTNLQALADVVQQQLPYLDIPLVTVALLHLALLFSRGQQQQQQRGVPTGASASNSTSASSGSESASSYTTDRISSGGGSSSSSSNGNGNGAVAAAAAAGGKDFPATWDGDDGLPLQMSSILDDYTDNGDHGTEDQGLSNDVAYFRLADLNEKERGNNGVDGAVAAAAGAEPSALLDVGDEANGAVVTAAAAALVLPAPPSPVAAALRVLVPVVLADLDGVGGSDLSKVVSALAVLRYDNRVVVEQLLQVLSLKLVECSPQELANMLVSLAMLGVPPDPFVRSNIYSAVKYQIRRFAPRDLALTLWAYGAMGTDVQEDAVLVLLEASKPKLAAFSPLNLAKVAQGLAALRYRPPPEWVAAYCEALRPALRRSAPRELCAILLALADLQVTLDDTTRATLLVHTLTSLPLLESPELALSIWALGRLTAAGLPALIDLDTSARVLEVTLARLREDVLSGGELQQLLEGLTRLSLQPPLEWMQAYVEVLKPKLATLETRQLAGVLGSLAAQQYRPEPEMQSVVMAATQDNMRQLLSDTTAAASLLTALRRLNIEPPAGWVAALLEASRSALKNRSSDLHLANMAGALAAWGVRPDGRWAARLIWRSQVLMQQGRMSPRALVALLQAMSALGLRPNPVWTQLCLQTATSRSCHPDFEPQHFSTLLPALHALEIQPPQEWLSRMMLSMYRCWDAFTMTHWSSMLPALVLLEAKPPREWLQRLEDVMVPRLVDSTALQLLTSLVSLAQLKRLGLEALDEAVAATTSAPSTATASTATVAATSTSTTHSTSATVASTAAVVCSPEGQGGYPGPLVPPATVEAQPRPSTRRGVNKLGSVARNPHPATSSVSSAAEDETAAASDAASATEVELAAAAAAISNDSMVLSLSRLRNLRTARWRQRRLAGLRVAEAMPSPRWMAAWWTASGSLLGRVRYAPSELLLTASWLVTLGLRPPSEWLEACIEVSQRYSKVMGPAEQMQLAAAVLPLGGRRANIVATKHTRRTYAQQAAVVTTTAAEAEPTPEPTGADCDSVDLSSSMTLSVSTTTAADKDMAAAKHPGGQRRRRWRRGKAVAAVEVK